MAEEDFRGDEKNNSKNFTFRDYLVGAENKEYLEYEVQVGKMMKIFQKDSLRSCSVLNDRQNNSF